MFFFPTLLSEELNEVVNRPDFQPKLIEKTDFLNKLKKKWDFLQTLIKKQDFARDLIKQQFLKQTNKEGWLSRETDTEGRSSGWTDHFPPKFSHRTAIILSTEPRTARWMITGRSRSPWSLKTSSSSASSSNLRQHNEQWVGCCIFPYIPVHTTEKIRC